MVPSDTDRYAVWICRNPSMPAPERRWVYLTTVVSKDEALHACSVLRRKKYTPRAIRLADDVICLGPPTETKEDDDDPEADEARVADNI